MIRKLFSVVTGKGKALIATATLAFTAAGLLGAYLMYLVIDMLNNIHTYKDGRELTGLWIALFGIVLLKTLMAVVADMSKHFAGFDVVLTVRKSIINRLKQFSLGFYSKERLGKISTIIHKDVDNLEGVVGHFFSIMFSDILIALLLGIWLFMKSPWMGLAMVSLLPLAVLMLGMGFRKNLKLQEKTNDDLADMVSLFVEYTKGIPLMKAFSENAAFETKLRSSIERFGVSARRQSKTVAGYVGRFSFFFELSYAVMIIVGALMLHQGSLNFETLLIFIIFSVEFYKPFRKIEKYWLDYLQVKDSYRRVEGVLEAPTVPAAVFPRKTSAFDITYEKVDFSYETDEFALKNINFKLPQGSLTALVGPSGSGKTTITNLLLRFWDIGRGSIQVGGVDIRDMDYDELLSNISIVMQNVVLFADSIYENIRLGNRNATREQVIEAAKKAQIHDFIAGLPEGYDTRVGENGVGLSGGQKQRISIARAFLKNAPIVVLDEITSNVDPVNETKIQKAVSALAKGRTVLVIAHHLRTIQTADQILVFDQGSLVEQGAHSLLLEKGGLYAQLWKAQEVAKGWKIA
ncbi:ABC transporter ATP-binding protein [Desulfosporosinus youngiae]|uniref:ABC-type multidrug transport system, ATPase and permease component n=1 Tax=Desulfosporosinus youngiae DSM 17734 TaxID=768710 RepID=H5Y653_9FIRM|nr:ABC transporter ATP-binding protein [Desulfosporosinus youngiae]EHQ91063.1 ABC-type multidrug transport system, ATPase and permease component [Desulfosporosinus youngiae DSM 17734]